jgi:alginate O-acetyltransferase complex protein AlgI
MALGTAHMLGYKLAQNFNMPYLAANVAEFWHRWHISLSSWLRDYLFIPLGGSRGGLWKTGRNLMITMLLGGLWHGASWTFVFWGGLHGLLLIGHRTFRGFCEQRPRLEGALQGVAGTTLRRVTTFLCVALCWVFFRATTFGAALGVLRRLAVPQAGAASPLPALSLWYTLALFVLCHALGHTGVWKRLTARLPAPALGLGYAAALSLALLLAPGATKTFIYFQF